MQGTLDTFGVVDVLQMLGRTRLSGTLHIECPQRVIDVRFLRGRIAETRDSTRRALGSALGRHLVAAGLVTEEQLASALASQEANPCPIGTLLVERGVLSEHDLREAISRQVANTLVAARLEAAGDFLFMTDHHPSDAELMTIDTQSVLLEISSLGGEFISAVELLGRYDTILVRNGFQSASALGITAADREEALLLAQVDGRRTVRDLAAASHLEEISVIALLGRLVASGALLVKVGLHTVDESDAALQARRDTVWAEVGRLIDVEIGDRLDHAVESRLQ